MTAIDVMLAAERLENRHDAERRDEGSKRMENGSGMLGRELREAVLVLRLAARYDR